MGEEQALMDGGAGVWLLPAPKISLTRLMIFSWGMRPPLALESFSLCLNRAPVMSWTVFCGGTCSEEPWNLQGQRLPRAPPHLALPWPPGSGLDSQRELVAVLGRA